MKRYEPYPRLHEETLSLWVTRKRIVPEDLYLMHLKRQATPLN